MSTVLVVNPDPIARNLLTRYLNDGGYDVLEAANRAEAVHIVKLFEREIDLAVVADPGLADTVSQINAIRSRVRFIVAPYDAAAEVSPVPPNVRYAFAPGPLTSATLLDTVRDLLRVKP